MTKMEELHSSAIVTYESASKSRTLFYDSRPAGSGKTHAEFEHVVQTPGMYLFACERKASIREHRGLVERLSIEHGSRIHIVEVMSSDHDGGAERSPSVRVQIEALPNTFRSGHVLALCTHAGLMDSDLSGFADWELAIDETPSVFESKKAVNGLTWRFLDEHFAIVPGLDLNAIMPSVTSTATTADFKRDVMAEPMAVLHRRACTEQYHVLTDVDQWSSLVESPSWRWTSIWSPTKLQAFSRVVVLANAFHRSLTYHVLSAIEPELSWAMYHRPGNREFERRKLTITYFASAHCATRGLFDKLVGKRRLSQIADWVAGQVGPENHIWTCNDRDKTLLAKLPGDRLSPRQAGSNDFAHIDAATMIYAAKADLDEREILQRLGVDPATATQTREYEAIYQFITRTSVRDPASARAVQVYVYDHAQAAYLSEMLSGTGYVDVELNPVDLGFLNAVYDAAAGRPKNIFTDEELSKRAYQKRIDDRDRKRKSRAKKQVTL